MRLAFCLFRYFPYGGLQRDLAATVAHCVAAGHAVRVYAQAWSGPRLDGCEVQLLPVSGLTNHARAARFADAVQERIAATRPDVVVGFDKMPGLDLYYAADPCFLEHAHGERHRAYRLTPRYRTFAALERGVFGPEADTRILLIDPRQEPVYRRWHETSEERFTHLPPGVARDRCLGDDAALLRTAARAEFGLADDDLLLLLLGSDFHRKGLDRAIRALAALPAPLRGRCRLLAVGADRPGRMQRLATRLGVGAEVLFAEGRDDVPALLQAADLMVHPARTENTGTVLLEALVAGLPVLTTAACGYAHYIDAAGAGTVLREPFRQQALEHSLERLLKADRAAYGRRGLAYAEQHDLHGQHAALLAEIEAVVAEPLYGS